MCIGEEWFDEFGLDMEMVGKKIKKTTCSGNVYLIEQSQKS